MSTQNIIIIKTTTLKTLLKTYSGCIAFIIKGELSKIKIFVPKYNSQILNIIKHEEEDIIHNFI